MRVRLICASVLAACLLGCSCTGKTTPVAAGGDTTVPPSSVAKDAELLEALTAAGVDLDAAPALVRQLGDRTFCGSDTPTHDTAELSPAARCFLDLHLAELDAVYVSTVPTVEGDPITFVHVSGRDGAIASFLDMTRDTFGTGRWERSDAPRAAVVTSFGTHRIDLVESVQAELDAPLPEAVDEAAPDWFVDRAPLRWCGMDVRVEDQNLEARQCFSEAVGRGEPAEYAVGQTGDEGERAIAWFRFLGPGQVEVIERSLPGVGPGAGGDPTWRRLTCDQVVFSDQVGAEVSLVPRVDEARCVNG